MRIGYISFEALEKTTPDPNVTVYSITEATVESHKTKLTGWKAFHVIPFQVLSCFKEFKTTDDQALSIGKYFKATLPTEGDILFQCTYGEVRSRILALSVSLTLFESYDVFKVVHGKWVHKETYPEGVFEGRTSAIIYDAVKT